MRWLPYEKFVFETWLPPDKAYERLSKYVGAPRLMTRLTETAFFGRVETKGFWVCLTPPAGKNYSLFPVMKGTFAPCEGGTRVSVVSSPSEFATGMVITLLVFFGIMGVLTRNFFIIAGFYAAIWLIVNGAFWADEERTKDLLKRALLCENEKQGEEQDRLP